MTSDNQKTRSREARPGAGDAEASEQPKEKRVEYLTAHQLAEVLQVSESTIHRLRRAGRIPAIALTDRLIRFNLRDVQKALRPTLAARAQSDNGADAGGVEDPGPQLSFEDLFTDFSK
ncbi:MAG TPA: helix-turn-helix domain-containing protein [Blastocatellia bacterium]|jgi:excisionase family DNA binding protein|nr:helix-turn-helix domain-containing protein [Blastocatellia bacterium]